MIEHMPKRHIIKHSRPIETEPLPATEHSDLQLKLQIAHWVHIEQVDPEVLTPKLEHIESLQIEFDARRLEL